MANELF